MSDIKIHDEQTRLADIDTLEGYLGAYGTLLGEKAVSALDPLYVPGESASLDLSMFRRPPFPCQAHVINAAAEAWKHTRSLIICGQMGTGKTLLGAAAIHASMLAKGNLAYRVLIMAPNHLIDKWEREILMTIAGSKVVKFEKSDPNKGDDSYKEVLRYARDCKSSTPGKWRKPEEPEWVIIGRNQAKWEPEWVSMVEPEHKFSPGVVRNVVVGREEARDKSGNMLFNSRGKPRWKYLLEKGVVCPKCGQPVRTDAGVLMSEAQMANAKNPIFCKGRYLQEVASDKRPEGAYDRMCPVPKKYRDLSAVLGREIGIENRVYEARECGEALWEWTPKPRKWAPARIFQKRCHNLFDFFVLDEMHEEKSDSSGQALAAGKCMTAAKRIIGLTGTLVGGYANHLFPLLMRMAPKTLIEEGFKWKGDMHFSKTYGRVDKTITTKYGQEASGSSKRKGSTCMAKGDGKSTMREEVKPGIMPTFFGRHLCDKAIFIGLEEMEGDLPDLIDDDRSLIPVQMDPELEEEYIRIQRELVSANNELIQKGNMKLMGTMLHTLMGYPDKPFGWEAPPGCAGDESIGWWKDSQNKLPENYVGVVSPANLAEDKVYAKEQALLDLIVSETNEGRQCWVYCEMTGKRDVQTRLANLIRAKGYSVKVLRSTTCEPRDREAWIAKEGPGVHVMISNPDLVSTGLDFFDKAKTFNFSTIIFYQPSYDINATRQAGHRHWRIGQPNECRTYYLYYQQSMQHRAVKHCGDKLAAAKSLEGSFSAEGLAALASGGLAMTEMARTLSEKIVDPRAAWGKLRPEARAKVASLIASGTILNLLTVAHSHEDQAVAAKAIAAEVALTPVEHVSLPGVAIHAPVELSDDSINDFFKAMAELGIDVSQL